MDIDFFSKRPWYYKPVSIGGWVITLLTLTACIWVFIVMDSHSHSVSDTLIGIFPYIIGFIVVASWIASNTSK